MHKLLEFQTSSTNLLTSFIIDKSMSTAIRWMVVAVFTSMVGNTSKMHSRWLLCSGHSSLGLEVGSSRDGHRGEAITCFVIANLLTLKKRYSSYQIIGACMKLKQLEIVKKKRIWAWSELKGTQPLPTKVWIQTSKINSNDLWCWTH